MRRLLAGLGVAAFISVALGLLAAVVAAGNAAPVASCTFEQKQPRVNALAGYQKGMRAARAAWGCRSGWCLSPA